MNRGNFTAAYWLMTGLLLPLSMLAQSSMRYVQPVFDKVLVTSGVNFSSAEREGQSSPTTLYFDFYEPSGDTLSARPLVITVFGGAFVAGSRDYVDMKAYGRRLAKHGYVVASIDYRLLPLLSIGATSLIRSMYMASQDVSSAVRFFKAYCNEYRIDTNNIFLLGNSAGSIAILNHIFMSDEERPAETFLSPDLGPIHSSGYDEYVAYSPKVSGAIAQWGGLTDIHIIDSAEYVPLCLIHGTEDTKVPYDSGYCYNSAYSFIMPYMYGSNAIANHLSECGVDDFEFHPFEGEGHCFYIQSLSVLLEDKFEACFSITRDFLYSHLLLPEPLFVLSKNIDKLQVFPNPTDDILIVELPDRGVKSVVLYDLKGMVITENNYNSSQSSTVLNLRNIPAGMYLIHVEDYDGKQCYRKIIRK